ncbi:LysR family transcriptional regulator [Pantoea ananatis]|uniref:LysR family transcriptional regulator n=1 Tax=Pantoea ananas TaxID=553 RepID=UPI001B3069FD|nr:LysR family transcriptional regulator [Pantoea ananatis]
MMKEEKMSYLQDWKVLIVLSQENSMTEAGKRLCMSTAAISKSIKRLENFLGEEIYVRGNKGGRLTSVGKKALTKAKVIIYLTDSIKFKVNPMLKEESEKVVVKAPSVFCDFVVSSYLSRINHECNSAHIHLDCKDCDSHCDYVDFNELIITSRNFFCNQSFRHPLKPLTLAWCATEEYLASSSEIHHPRDLEKQDVLGFHGGDLQWPLFMRNGIDVYNGLNSLEFKVSSSSYMSMFRLMLDSKGVMIAPLFLIRSHQKKSHLKIILSDWELPKLNVFLLWGKYDYEMDLHKKIRREIISIWDKVMP